MRHASSITLQFASLLIMTVGPVSAWSQVVTPPPAQMPAIDADIPKLPPRVIAPPTEEQMKNARSLPNDMVKQGKPQRAPLPTDVDYNVLITKDAGGKVLPLQEHLHMAALKKNPKVPADFFASDTLKSFLAERRKNMEFVLVNNLDLFDKIEDGLFEQAKFDEREKIQALLNAVKPISHPAAPNPLTKELRARDMLTAEQAAVNEELIRRYTFAANQAQDPNIPEEQRKMQAWNTIIALYKQNVDEFLHIHSELSLAGGKHLAEIVPSLSLDSATGEKLKPLMSSFSAAGTTPEKLASLKGLREVFTLDQRKEWLKAASAYVGK